MRETRGSAAAREVHVETPVNKRKRSSPAPPLKIVLPAPASLESEEQEPKRQKISIKINGVKRAKSPVKDALGPDVRAALALVIAQMAKDLPPPLNGILALSLPPKFEKTDENTLGYLLQQDNLTWDVLVNTLHTFSENLLVPCAYPNPMPSLSQFHLPIPPLPSHYPPHAIYNFCAALHSVMLQIEPHVSTTESERWALMQRQSGDWFTSSVDFRQTSSLQDLAAAGDKFGYATAVAVQSAIQKPGKPSSLSESLLQRASLKASRWKEARTRGSFGSVTRGVIIPPVTSASFTPGFAPTYDSTFSTGGFGYHSTIQSMHERTRHNQWSTTADRPIEFGYWGSEDSETTPESTRLDTNASLLAELHAWQGIRVRRGEHVPTEREQEIADALLSSLTTLAATTSPKDLISSVSVNAHDLADRFLPVPSPVLRGTLDPKRPHAIHDNATLRPGVASRSAYPPAPGRPTPGASPAPSAPWPHGDPRSGAAAAYTRPGPGPSRLSQSFGPNPYGLGGPRAPGASPSMRPLG